MAWKAVLLQYTDSCQRRIDLKLMSGPVYTACDGQSPWHTMQEVQQLTSTVHSGRRH